MKMRALVAGLLCCTVFAFSAQAQAEETYEWTLNTGVGETTQFYKFYTLPLVERVAELTEGKVILKPQPAGVLTPALKAHEALKNGLAETVQAPPIFLYSEDPVNAMFNSWPGGMGPEALFQWMYMGGGKELLAEYRRETMGLHSLPSGLCCSEVTFSTKPLRTVEDFKGLKMRTIGAFADVLTQYFGASPVVMPGSEVYTALERGAIDAADWSGPSENMTAGLHEAARYVIYPGPQTNAFFMEFVMDAARWDALPDNIKVEIEAATRIATMDTMMLFNQADMRAWEQLKQNAAAGTNEIVRMDDATVEAFRNAGRELANKIADEQTAKGNPWMRRVVDSYYAYYDYWLANSGWRAQDWQASN